MGKDGFLTPKAIGNRIKAKGLQRLRWYCQLCQKQCRDENGFKCHQTSDSHMRQMDLFGMNPGKVVAEYSAEFEKMFLDHLKRAHPFSRVMAKNVYNEYINDKHHIHMNSTRWLTLTEFVKYLGREGKCKVDETEKGWFITLIHRDPMQEIDDEKKLKRTEAEREENERHNLEIDLQVARARKYARTEEGPTEATELVKSGEAPLVLSLKPGQAGDPEPSQAAGPSGLPPRAPPGRALAAASSRPGAPGGAPRAAGAAVFGDEEEEDHARGPGHSRASGAAGNGKGSSKLDQLMHKELDAKKRESEAAALRASRDSAASAAAASSAASRLGHWLAVGVVVKVMAKELAPHGYYKQKGVVEKVSDKYVGEVAMLGSGDVVRVDQAQLETVIPQPGGTVLMVNGVHRGSKAVLEEIDVEKFRARVKLSGSGKEVWADYEDICKLASST